jgi:hypothetical protein
MEITEPRPCWEAHHHSLKPGQLRWTAFRYRLVWALCGRPDERWENWKTRYRVMSVLFPCNRNGLITRGKLFWWNVKQAWENF